MGREDDHDLEIDAIHSICLHSLELHTLYFFMGQVFCSHLPFRKLKKNILNRLRRLGKVYRPTNHTGGTWCRRRRQLGTFVCMCKDQWMILFGVEPAGSYIPAVAFRNNPWLGCALVASLVISIKNQLVVLVSFIPWYFCASGEIILCVYIDVTYISSVCSRLDFHRLLLWLQFICSVMLTVGRPSIRTDPSARPPRLVLWSFLSYRDFFLLIYFQSPITPLTTRVPRICCWCLVYITSHLWSRSFSLVPML